MTLDESNTYERLLRKSQEAFLLAIELYNRPSIRYHAEGCAFFLCNAWELMLKAYIIRRDGEEAVYYKDNPGRTLSLNNCLSRVFTNENDPLRINLEKIIDLRNTSTHFVTDEYELFYGPLLQVCVKNFDDKLREFHGKEISDIIPESYLVLSVKRDLIDPEKVRTKYSPEVAEKLLTMNNSVAFGAGDDGSPRYSGLYETSFVVTKNPKKADLAVHISKNDGPGIAIIKEVQKAQDKYPYTTSLAIEEIRRRLGKAGVELKVGGDVKQFNTFHWGIFVRFYGFKGEPRFAYDRSLKTEKQTSYIYSQQAIDLVVDEVTRDSEHVIDTMRSKLKQK